MQGIKEIGMNTWKSMKNLYHDESGDILQVGIIMGILAVIAVGALVFMGPKIKAMFDKSGAALGEGKGVGY
jgi:Flp pilus assembly pilin Flp